MDPARLTQKSQEALHDAQTKALRLGNTDVDAEHLLLALTDQGDGIVPRLLSQAGVDTDRLRTALEAELARRPRLSGSRGCWTQLTRRRNGSRTSTCR